MTKYFRGYKCNQGWEALESAEAKKLRGKGMYTFGRILRSERGTKCQDCGVEEGVRQQDELHMHHIKKRRTHRHLSFERDNVLLLCQKCHRRHELGDLETSTGNAGEQPVINGTRSLI